jgi:hypothetical protein
MATVAPFHSSQNPGVYHVCSICTEGNNIERQDRRPGTGGGHLRDHCRRLQSQGGC